MGSSTVITHIILFIAVLSIASGLLVVIKNYADQTEGTFVTKSDEYNKQIKTNIHIEVVHFDNNTNTTWIYVRNTGQTVMDPVQVDVYIDGFRFPRNDSNRTISVSSDTELTNAGLWDPREQILIKAFRSLDSAISHEVVVTTPYSVRDQEGFSV
jgi:archaellum component FlaF (FlaF/FlaG flagellin family)